MKNDELELNTFLKNVNRYFRVYLILIVTGVYPCICYINIIYKYLKISALNILRWMLFSLSKNW